jgi:hypothetical protein
MGKRVVPILVVWLIITSSLVVSAGVPEQLIKRITGNFKPMVQQILGDNYRDFKVILNHPTLPTGCYFCIELLDDSPNGDFWTICKMVGFAILADKETKNLNIEKVFITALDRDSHARASFKVSMSEDPGVRRNFLRLKDLDQIPKTEREWMLLWIATWELSKGDSTWTAADKMILSELMKAEKENPKPKEDLPRAYRPLTVHHTCIAALTEAGAQKISKMLFAKDFDAVGAMVDRGEAVVLKKGMEVYDAGSGEGWLNTSRKIRLKGLPDEFWVSAQCDFERSN